jgi:hypothetical protein
MYCVVLVELCNAGFEHFSGNGYRYLCRPVYGKAMRRAHILSKVSWSLPTIKDAHNLTMASPKALYNAKLWTQLLEIITVVLVKLQFKIKTRRIQYYLFCYTDYAYYTFYLLMQTVGTISK